MSTETKQNPWIAFFVTFLMGITVAMGMFKVPTNFGNICAELNTIMPVAVNCMSVVGLACIFTSIPAGAVMQKFGVKKFGLVCMAAAILENIIGYFAPSIEILIASRLLEAISYGCISMVSAAIIANGFPPEKRGLPNGIWVMWVSLANMIIPQITTLMTADGGSFRGVWMVVAVCQVVMTLLFVVVVKDQKPVAEEEAAGEKGSIMDGLKEPGVWCISLFGMGLAIGCGCFTGLFPNYLQSPEVGFDMVTANNIISVANIGGLIGCLAVGTIINMVAPKNRGILAIVIALISIVCFAMQYHLPAQVGVLTAFAVFFAAVSNINVPVTFAWAPDVLKRPEALPMALGVVSVGLNVGGALSLNIPSMMQEAGGTFAAADPFILGCAVVGLIGAIGAHVICRKVLAAREA